VPRLVLLNGPPGSGKSIIAKLYVAEHPLTLNLDLDHVRRLLGRWQDAPEEAGLLTRRIALAMAQTHLNAGHDVLVPQYLGRIEFIEQLDMTARAVSATFREIVLLLSKQDALARFSRRTAAAANPTHAEAQEMLDREGGQAALADMYDRLLTIIAARPRTIVLDAPDGEPDATYRLLLDALA
jgi:predicted kinase